MTLKWPSDALVIVASRRGTAVVANMLAVVRTSCRHCGAPLDADARSIVNAVSNPARQGRPIDYFCVECCTTHYDVKSVDVLVDDRRTNKPVRRKP